MCEGITASRVRACPIGSHTAGLLDCDLDDATVLSMLWGLGQ